jgi:oxalate decarboxylase
MKVVFLSQYIELVKMNFGVDRKVFNSVHSNFPYILNGTVSKDLDKAPVE